MADQPKPEQAPPARTRDASGSVSQPGRPVPPPAGQASEAFPPAQQPAPEAAGGGTDRQEAPPASDAPLGDAGASADPEVHQLLAHLAIAERNDDKQGAEELRKRLAELGVQ